MGVVDRIAYTFFGSFTAGVETEALRQTVLVDLLRRHLDDLLPEPLRVVHERAERQRRAVRKLLGGTAGP